MEISLSSHATKGETLVLRFEGPGGLSHTVSIPTSSRYAFASLLETLRSVQNAPKARVGTAASPTQAQLETLLSAMSQGDKAAKTSRRAVSETLKTNLFEGDEPTKESPKPC